MLAKIRAVRSELEQWDTHLEDDGADAGEASPSGLSSEELMTIRTRYNTWEKDGREVDF